MRRQAALLRAVLACAMLASTVLAGPTGAAAPESLKPGDARFWPVGDYVDTTKNSNAGVQDFELTTTDGGYRLRVGLDLLLGPREDTSEHEFADLGRSFTVDLLRDDEEEETAEVVVSGGNADGPWGYSVELFVCFTTGAGCDGIAHRVPCVEQCDTVGEPLRCDSTSCFPKYTKLLPGSSEGAWTIRVTPKHVDSWQYRVRAALERPPSPPDERADRYLSPNLRAIPPFELTLRCTSVQGSVVGTRKGVCGDEALVGSGCTALEQALNLGVKRCLRFSGGEEVAGAAPGSAGDGGGPLEIEGRDPVADPLTGDVTARAVQIRRARDGSVAEHDAGQLVFHGAHGHWHYDGFMHYQLFEVTGHTSLGSPPAKKQISDKDLGSKRGWGPTDERMADWSRVNQGVNNGAALPPPSPGCPSPCPLRLYQTAGWGDFYEWPVEEQFVPLPTVQSGSATSRSVKSGFYLLREVIDMPDRIVESDETDNTSYAYFQVTEAGSLDQLAVVERGYGQDPWDPRKIVVP